MSERPPIYVDQDGNELDPVEVARGRIDACALVEKLQQHVESPCMDMTQINAAHRLLEFVMAKAEAVRKLSLTDNDGQPIAVQIVQFSQPAAPQAPGTEVSTFYVKH